MKIDKHIPIPNRPWGKMKVGDSVKFSKAKGQKARISAHNYGHGRKFLSKTQGNYIRIWRIK